MPDDPEDVDPHLVRERTRMAWIRTAIAFAAVGGALLKVNVPAGAAVLALSPVIWLTGRTSVRATSDRLLPVQLRLITLAVILTALVVLLVVLFGHTNAGFHAPAHQPR